MGKSNLVSANKAFRKGLWQVRIWPLIVVVLSFVGLTYATVQMGFPIEWAAIVFASIALFCSIWSLIRIGTWKSWMAANTVNPKTAIEMAKSSFLKQAWKEKFAFWGKAKKLQYREDFDARMSAVKEEYLKDAKERYAHKRPVIVHYRFSSLLWMLLFEVVVLTGLLLLFVYQTDNTLRMIAGALFLIGFAGLIYTLKTIWKRNQTVIEITLHGITIEGKHFGWIELEKVDIVKGDTLIYQKHKGPEIQFELKNLSLSGDYLDELILFYRTSDTSIKEA
ncbi:MAG: hypothetical protein ACI8SE_000082 [Bacteroidia bacterium]|jgi:hypothetical protein